MTVYKAYKPEAETAAELAVALANDDQALVAPGQRAASATLLDPVSVTKENIKDTVVKDGLYTVADICTASFAAACTAAGLSIN